MILLLLSVVIFGYVGYLQVLNWKERSDHNGHDKTRVLFMVQIFLLTVISIALIGGWYKVARFPMLIVSFNSLAFYKGWDLRKVFRK